MFKESFINALKKNKSLHLFWKGNYGIEKENLRIDQYGKLAQTKHPKEFANKLKNPYITIDFAEAQVEMITPVCKTLEEALSYLKNIESTIYTQLNDEYLWPQSNPCILPEDDKILIGEYDNSLEGKKARAYREELANKYGRKKQTLSGIHYNFSFDENLLKLLYNQLETSITFKEFKNSLYLHLSRNFFNYRWLLIYLFGASPVVHETYNGVCIKKLDQFNEDSYSFQNSISFRNGKCGYRNRVEEFVPYDKLENYISKIEDMIEKGLIQNEKEYYSPLRLKSKDGSLEMLKKEGIEYLEIRLLDINPFDKSGISIETLYFVQGFLYYMLELPDKEYNEKTVDIANKNHYVASCMGLSKDLYLYDSNDNLIEFRTNAMSIVEKMENFYIKNSIMNEPLERSIDYAKNAIRNSSLTIASKIKSQIKEKNYLNFHMELAKKFKKDFLYKTYSLLSFEDLELSTQILIRESIKRGISVEVLDRKENFISLEKDGKIEYVKQATKTSADTYISSLIMENKLISKKLLKDSNIKVPLGYNFDNIETAMDFYNLLEKKALVIKPNNTNFGIGISIFKEFPSFEEYKEALTFAFSEDSTVLLEEFIQGKEYRFLVINDELVGVLHRRPANVQGDGINSIESLVDIKNKDPLRGTAYTSPLEKIKLGKIEEDFLKKQNLNRYSIPLKDEIIYLRENSNISTGGDSIDFTDEIHESYKVEAIKATKAIPAKICGVDMMIDNIKIPKSSNNYAIIEVNFNPAIHIHSYPYIGKNRRAGEKILNLLGF